jgi:hypothetical protein
MLVHAQQVYQRRHQNNPASNAEQPHKHTHAEAEEYHDKIHC